LVTIVHLRLRKGNTIRDNVSAFPTFLNMYGDITLLLNPLKPSGCFMYHQF